MNILIVDDHAIVRRGLIQLLKEEFLSIDVTEASNSNEVNAKIKNKVWDIILLDISLSGQNGIEILTQLRDFGIKAPILMLSSYPEELYALRVLNAGANGFLNKNNAPDQLVNTIKKILSGKKYITSTLDEKLPKNTGDFEKITHELLSDRELQIFMLLAAKKSISEIASAISLSDHIITNYQTRILEKMGFTTNVELLKYAIDNGLLD